MIVYEKYTGILSITYLFLCRVSVPITTNLNVSFLCQKLKLEKGIHREYGYWFKNFSTDNLPRAITFLERR